MSGQVPSWESSNESRDVSYCAEPCCPILFRRGLCGRVMSGLDKSRMNLVLCCRVLWGRAKCSVVECRVGLSGLENFQRLVHRQLFFGLLNGSFNQLNFSRSSDKGDGPDDRCMCS